MCFLIYVLKLEDFSVEPVLKLQSKFPIQTSYMSLIFLCIIITYEYLLSKLKELC